MKSGAVLSQFPVVEMGGTLPLPLAGDKLYFLLNLNLPNPNIQGARPPATNETSPPQHRST
ncbi:hypothetical protein ACS0TY_031409 [Phlomoides rotata]